MAREPDRRDRAQEIGVGRELISFRPRVSGAQQVKEVEARGWDYKTKDKVTQTARPARPA